MLSGCSGGAVEDPSSAPSATVTATPEASPTSSSPTPDPTPTETATEAELEFAVAPTARLDAGVIAADAPVTIQGEGPTTVTFSRALTRVAATLNCSACTGPVSFNSPRRTVTDPLGAGVAPWSGTMLVDFGSQGDGGEVWIDAVGPWTLELLAHGDLPVHEAAVTGTGHAAVLLLARSNNVDFWCRPLPGETCQVYAYSLVETGTIAGTTSEIEETTTIDVVLPAVVGVRTNGEWSLTP